jgi:Ser/Thr protein kinase RdoA (MazF antagonist)
MSSTLSNETLLSALHGWHLSEPLIVQRLLGGFTSEVWDVQAGREHFVAKYTYRPEADFVGGLYAAELVERHGIPSGAPLRTKEGALSILVEGPHGQRQPLALLHFVPGERLKPSEPHAASLYGHLLGRIHSILLDELGEHCTADLHDFLLQEDAHVATQPDLALLINHAIQAAQDYEVRRHVTYGVIWGDGMEIRCEKKTGRVGIIDWGTIAHGPLLFDVALSVLWLFPEGSQAHRKFLQAYLAEAPIAANELEDLNYYKALLWARQAKYFAYRVAASVTLGDPNPNGNTKSLAESRQELEHLLANL